MPKRDHAVPMSVSLSPAFKRAIQKEAAARGETVSTMVVGIVFGFAEPVKLFKTKGRK